MTNLADTSLETAICPRCGLPIERDETGRHCSCGFVQQTGKASRWLDPDDKWSDIT
jgi:hypothetical protein